MTVLHHPTHADLQQALGNAVYDLVRDALEHSRAGHCLRINALPEPIMHDLCNRFNNDGTEADVVMLIGPRQTAQSPWQISATRLIELRNAEQRPLLAFVPPGLKVAAEDSFDISTFREIDLKDVPRRLRRQLQAQLPEDLGQLAEERVVQYLEQVERLVTADDIWRYYLTVLHNGGTREAFGGALYQLKLVPDFMLLSIPDRIKQRLDRNAAARRTLLGSSQPLLGRIHELALEEGEFQARFYRFLHRQNVDDVRAWGALIATDAAYQEFAFDRWPFRGEALDRDDVCLFVDDLSLAPRDRAQPPGPDNPLYLDVKRASSVRLQWETNPKPAAVQQLAYFRIEIVSADGAVAWESRNIPKGTSASASRSKSLKVAEFRDQVQDGLYFFRVRAYSDSGDMVNDEDPERLTVLRDKQNPEGKRINESEDVWFWVDEDAPPPAEPQRNVTVQSFLDAQLQVQFAALDRGEDPFNAKLTPRQDKTGWATVKRESRAEVIYNIVYDAQTRFSLPVSNLLRNIESETLAHPETLGRWRLNFTDHESKTVQPMLRQYRDLGQVPDEFLQARRAVFAAIGGAQGDITATVDLTQHADVILAYAEAYSSWLGQVQTDFESLATRQEDRRKRTDAIFLDIDTVEVILPDGNMVSDHVYLVAPTHPVRLLWHLQRARMAQAWLRSAVTAGQGRELLTRAVRRTLQTGLVPVNLPPILRPAHEAFPEGVSRFYVEQGPLTLFWSLYTREDVQDSRSLRARVRKVLGIGRGSAASATSGGISKETLLHKLRRYLAQHPYVNVLKLNVFNPGDAAVVVEAILGLEKERRDNRLPDLRYDLRLFTQHPRIEDVGEAIDELLNPERQVSAEADAFTGGSQNHLFPKLRFSRNLLSDFLADAPKYDAHISILHDLFPVGVEAEALKPGRSSFAYGLLQEQVTHFTGDDTYYAWQRQLVPMPCQELPDGAPMSGQLAALLGQMATLQASVAAGRYVEGYTPTVQLQLGTLDKNLLNQIHAVSDWVFIIDRHLGLEYFDSDAGDDRPVYLLDFTPEFGGSDIERLLLTTRAVDEITGLIRPVLDDFNLSVGEGVEMYFLHLLRSLSGRLALKLVSSPNDVGGAVGLALARLFLEQYGLLEDHIVIPLDAHAALFTSSGQNTAEDEVAWQRGDLLLVACNPETRQLRFHIVEVKLRGDLRDFNAYTDLRQRIEGQLAQSETALRQHFDPTARPVDRIDRQFKTKELIALLQFYLARSRRYGLVSASAYERLRPFIESLDAQYDLSCAGVGLIFDLGYEGLKTDEEHAGLVFHRVGQDYVRRLLDNGLRRRSRLQSQTQSRPATIEESEAQRVERQRITRDTSMGSDESYERVRAPFTLSKTLTASLSVPTKSPAVEPHEPTPQSNSVILSTTAPTDTRGEDTLPGSANNTPTPGIGVVPTSGPLPVPTSPVSTVRSVERPTQRPAPPPSDQSVPPSDVWLGETGESHQFGVFGRASGKVIALDLNGTNTISLFGVQGGGKSYTLGSIVEMATQSLPHINRLPSPLASVIFHYHESQDYAPEFVSMIAPNDRPTEVKALAKEYGATPAALDDVLVLTSADKLADRRAEFPGVQVEPIAFSSAELSFKDWRFLMGVAGNQMYMKQINLIMRQLRDRMTLDSLRREIELSDLSDGQKSIARIRLDFAAQFIDDNHRLADLLRPGRLVIVDLRDEFIDKDEALGLFVVMLNIFANAGREENFNKLIVFDEAHKYMDNPELTSHIVDVIRQMRHQGVSILIASQDPPSLPNAIIELSSLVILHRFNSPQWLKHIQRSITALADLTPAQLAALGPGEAYVWATKATERIFTQKAVKMQFRPRVTQHGGGTKTAV